MDVNTVARKRRGWDNNIFGLKGIFGPGEQVAFSIEG